MDLGQRALIVLNVSNEIAVAKFLKGEIRFLDIANEVKQALESTDVVGGELSIEEVISFNHQIRQSF